MASIQVKLGSFVWTDNEVELLLCVTSNYKTMKYQVVLH